MLRFFKKRTHPDKKYFRIIQDIFGIIPNNIEFYKLALIHRSASLFLENGTPMNNERLEFLGDAILEAVVSDFLFVEYTEMNEGTLTQMRSRIVSRSTLNELCIKIGLSKHIISNYGGAFVQKHIHGDALEAVIGAIYLDKGYEVTNRVIINNILKKHLNIDEMIYMETDFKSRLIEWCQKSKHTITFDTGFAENSTTHNPVFRSVTYIDGMELGYGYGASKKEAEQQAALLVSGAMSESIGDSLLSFVDNARVKTKSKSRAADDR